MQQPTPNMEVSTPKTSKKKRQLLISIALVVVVLTSLFSVIGEPAANGRLSAAGMDDGSWLPDPPSGPWSCGGFFQPPCPPPPTPDPGIPGLDCDNLKMNVAIMIDRSDSVIRDAPTGVDNEDLYKEKVKLFVDTLYQSFRAQNGDLGFLIYAFGTQSVLQYEGDASDPMSYAATLQAIDDIWFRNGETFVNKNNRDQAGFQTRNNQPSEIPYGYDAGHTNAHGIYGKTNWHDAFVKIIEKQSTTYNDPEQGKKIDLAVMFTDGLPDKTDSYDWKWTPGNYLGPNAEVVAGTYGSYSTDTYPYLKTDDLYRPETENSAKSYAENAVELLRSGAALTRTTPGPFWFSPDVVTTLFPSRPPVSVRGIVIQQNASGWSNSEDFTQGVFRNGQYYLSADFDAALTLQIENMAKNVFDSTPCGDLLNRITPGLTITPESGAPSPVRPAEGQPGIPIEYTVTNSSTSTDGTGTIMDVKVCIGTGNSNDDVYDAVNHVCINGADTVTIGTLTLGESATFTYTYTSDFGDPNRTVILVPFGQVDIGDGELDGPEYPVTNTIVDVEPKKGNLPA